MGVLRTCVLVTIVASQAYAEPDPAETAYQAGLRHYDLREWDEAAASFKEAYRRRPEAKSLYNTAQAYRQKGDCLTAQGFYKTYRRNYPHAKNIAAVDKFIADLEPCVQAAHKTASEPPPEKLKPEPTQDRPSAASAAPNPTPAPALPPPAGHSKLVPVVVGIGGVALLGLGIGAELWGESTYNDAKAEMTDQVRRQALYDSANTKRYAAEGLGAIGIGCIAVSAWLLVRHRDESPATASHVLVSPHGVAVTGTF